jgi:hypothetical protein
MPVWHPVARLLAATACSIVVLALLLLPEDRSSRVCTDRIAKLLPSHGGTQVYWFWTWRSRLLYASSGSWKPIPEQHGHAVEGNTFSRQSEHSTGNFNALSAFAWPRKDDHLPIAGWLKCGSISTE